MNFVLQSRRFKLAWPVLLLPIFAGLGLSGQDETEEETAQRHFTLKVLPLLTEKCFPCHGDDPEEIEGGLILNTPGGRAFLEAMVLAMWSCPERRRRVS